MAETGIVRDTSPDWFGTQEPPPSEAGEEGMRSHEGREMTEGDMSDTVSLGVNPEDYARIRAGPVEPPCEHQWVLGHRWSTYGLNAVVGPPVDFHGLWVCQCGEAKVVEYEV